MNKTKVLFCLVILLSLLNIGLILSLFLNKQGASHWAPNHHGPNKADKFIQNEFDLTDAELSIFSKSKSEHIEQSTLLNVKLKELSSQFYSGKDQAEKDRLLAEIMELSREIYSINDQHLNDLRSIVKPGKEKELDRFINHLIQGDHRARRGGKHHKHHKGKHPKKH